MKHAAPAAAAENICTEQIGQDLSAFRHESDLIGYLTAHTYSREQWHHSTRTQILELLEKCKALAREDEENWPRDQEDHFAPAKELPKVLGNDRLLNIIYGFRASVRKGDGGLSIRKDYDFPEALRNNWISKQSLSDVATGKNVSDEVYRKTQILLSFYNFYADLYCAEDLWHSEDPVDVRGIRLTGSSSTAPPIRIRSAGSATISLIFCFSEIRPIKPLLQIGCCTQLF